MISFDFKQLTKEQQQKLILGVLLSCIVLVMYYYFLLQPQLKRLSSVIPEARDLRQQWRILKEELQRMDLLKGQFNRLNQEIQDYQKAIPLEGDWSPLLSYLSSQAKSQGVTLLAVEPKIGEMVSGSQFQKGSLLIQARGGYHALGLFLNHLETGERLIKVEGFELAADSKNTRQHQMKLDLTTYVAKQ